MKRYVLMIWCCCGMLFSVKGQGVSVPYNYRFGVQAGVDVGGVLPTPLDAVPTVFRAYPRVMPTVGGKVEISLIPDLFLGMELNYKHLSMSVDAVVENMRASIPGQGFGGEALVQYFTGEASIEMSFDVLEVPLYISYAFPKSERNRFLFGVYAAWVMRSRFVNVPIQGFVGSAPDQVDLIINKGDKVPEEQCDFSSYLHRWDWGLIVGYEREVFHRFNVGVHLSCGMRDIFTEPILTYNMTQIRGSVLFSYALWEVK